MNGRVAAERRFDGVDLVPAADGASAQPVPRPLLPLVVDLDAGVRRKGLGWELVLAGARARPGALPALTAAAWQGRAALEETACGIAGLDVGSLPLAPSCRAALRQAEGEERPVVLLTGRHAPIAQALADRHTIVSEVIVAAGGDDVAELARAAALRRRCPAGFVALAASGANALWARTAPGYALTDAPETRPDRPSALRLWTKALRLHQWAKNGLVFVPPMLAGHALDPASWLIAAVAFLAFGLAASSTYLLNDLHDLGPDRAHRSKRHRPLASGALPIPHALAAACLGLAGCLGLASLGGPAGVATIAAYLGLTLAYTFAIKRYMVVDTVALAGLFTLRLVGGIAFCAVAGSAWLLAFSMFVFTSLALAKRFVEIEALGRAGLARVAGRGYTVQDGPAVLALGAGASTAAVLILSLYIVEATARAAFYVHPELLWAAPVALFLWLGRVWILCGRGALRDDPVEFALSDRPSLALGLVILASFALACASL